MEILEVSMRHIVPVLAAIAHSVFVARAEKLPIASHATNHNSSELSACFAITGGIFADGFESGDTSAWQ